MEHALFIDKFNQEKSVLLQIAIIGFVNHFLRSVHVNFYSSVCLADALVLYWVRTAKTFYGANLCRRHTLTAQLV